MDSTMPNAAALNFCAADAAKLADYQSHFVMDAKSKRHFAQAVREGINIIQNAAVREKLLGVCAETEAGPPEAINIIQCGFGLLLHMLAAAIAGSENENVRRLFLWPCIARNLSHLANSLETQAPNIAATLGQQAESLYSYLKLDRNGCHCPQCAAIAAVKSLEQELDAVNGPTLPEWISLVDNYRRAVAGFIEVSRPQSPQPHQAH